MSQHAQQQTHTVSTHDGEIFDPDDPEFAAYLASAVVLPPAPRCERCEHQICPRCLTWCDRLSEPSGGAATGCIELCCGGRCTVDPLEAVEWGQRVAALLELADRQNRPLVHADGPYHPLRARAFRGALLDHRRRTPSPACGDDQCIHCPPLWP